MVRTIVSTVAVVGILFCGTISGKSQETPKRQKITNHQPVINSITVSERVIDLCPWEPTGVCNAQNGLVSVISVDASDRDGERLVYKYSVTGGRIVGQGPNVQWDFKDVPFGLYSVTVTVKDTHGASSSRSTNVKVEPCGTCDPPRPVLSIGCPDAVEEGQVAVFAVFIAGTEFPAKLKFKWSVSAGRIKSGQGQQKIEVDTTGVVGSLVATVEVEGFDPAYPNTASCTIEVRKKSP